jgi:hypothetical protein
MSSCCTCKARLTHSKEVQRSSITLTKSQVALACYAIRQKPMDRVFITVKNGMVAESTVPVARGWPQATGKVSPSACLRRAYAACLALTIGTTVLIAGMAGPEAPNPPVQIHKVSFLIHPVCWDLGLDTTGRPSRAYISLISRMRGGAWFDEREYLEVLAWEKRVNEKQRQYISKMGPDEVLIVYPIGNRKAMTDLQEYAEQRLGRRCIIVHSTPPIRNEDPRQFLPEPLKSELMDELVETVQKNGYDWSAGALKVILYNRKIAMEIRREFGQRGLHFDPTTVKMLAFGEGFEQCAMTWKAMLPYYLDLREPIENDYELSVSGMPLLRLADFKERVALQGDVRLFLWQLRDGRPMGLFARGMARLADPQLFTSISVDPKKIAVFSEGGEQFWPSTSESGPAVRASSGSSIRIPVYTALRQFPTDKADYIVGDGLTFDEFRRALVSSGVVDK